MAKNETFFKKKKDSNNFEWNLRFSKIFWVFTAKYKFLKEY